MGFQKLRSLVLQQKSGQKDEATVADTEKVFADVASGAKRTQPELNNRKAMLRVGDTVIIEPLDQWLTCI